MCCFSNVRRHLSYPLMLFLPPSLSVAKETDLRASSAAAAGSILSLSLSQRRARCESLGISGVLQERADAGTMRSWGLMHLGRLHGNTPGFKDPVLADP